MIELVELRKLVGQAIDCFGKNLNQVSDFILSEGDFERLLTNKIEECLTEEYVIHNQVSYYGHTNALKYRVDCVVMKKDEVRDSIEYHKGYKYTSDSIAIELKYYRKNADVSTIKKDIDKSNVLEKSNAFLFVVALLEEDKGKADKILNIANKYNNKNFSVKILIKNKEIWKSY